jgi:hypothetical protein
MQNGLILLGLVDVWGQKHTYFREDLRCFGFEHARIQEDLRCFAFCMREGRGGQAQRNGGTKALRGGKKIEDRGA